jgi:hypothetical protein
MKSLYYKFCNLSDRMRCEATLVIMSLAVLCTASLACNSVQLKDDLCGNGAVVTGTAFSEEWGLSSGLLVVPQGKYASLAALHWI